MKLKPLAVVLLGCATPLLSQAGRPLQTEDAGVLEAKTCEVEGVSGRARVAGTPSVRDNALQLGSNLTVQGGGSTATQLCLRGNLIGDSGARALAAAFQNNSTLKVIDLSDNQIGEGGKTALRAAQAQLATRGITFHAT